MHLDLNLLRVFIAVAETGSFTWAAARLHATQSTVSQRISRLEHQLERQLLERTTRSTQLTTHGEVLLRYARQVDALATEIRAEFSDELLTGEVRFSVPEDFIDAGFADILGHFKALQPKMKVQVRIGLAAEQRAWLEAGEIDLAVIRSVEPESERDALWSEPLYWVASDRLARELARGEHATLPLVHVPAPCLYREVAMDRLSESTIHWNVVMTCPHLEGIRAGVMAGLGVAAVPQSAAPNGCVTLGERHGLPPLPDCNLLLHERDESKSDKAVHALKGIVAEYRWKMSSI